MPAVSARTFGADVLPRLMSAIEELRFQRSVPRLQCTSLAGSLPRRSHRLEVVTFDTRSMAKSLPLATRMR